MLMVEIRYFGQKEDIITNLPVETDSEEKALSEAHAWVESQLPHIDSNLPSYTVRELTNWEQSFYDAIKNIPDEFFTNQNKKGV